MARKAAKIPKAYELLGSEPDWDDQHDLKDEELNVRFSNALKGIGVKKGGCAGMEYTMDYAEEQLPLDEVVEDKGVTIFIEAKAVLFLLGTEMDYEEGLLSSGFTFNNPNQTDACGCGESVTIIPAAAPPGYKPVKN